MTDTAELINCFFDHATHGDRSYEWIFARG
jgi:hypothetical protein